MTKMTSQYDHQRVSLQLMKPYNTVKLDIFTSLLTTRFPTADLFNRSSLRRLAS